MSYTQGNNGLVTETNQQYYQGAQVFVAVNNQKDFVATFDTDLVLGSIDPTETNYALKGHSDASTIPSLPLVPDPM